MTKYTAVLRTGRITVGSIIDATLEEVKDFIEKDGFATSACLYDERTGQLAMKIKVERDNNYHVIDWYIQKIN